MNEEIQYEIPLNECYRSLLRLEYLFIEIKRQLQSSHRASHYYCLRQLFVLIDFFERSDFKAELIRELERKIKVYHNLEELDVVDQDKLHTFLEQLGTLSSWFRGQHSKIGSQLLTDSFLSQAKNKLSLRVPRLSFDAPAVKSFLSMDAELRKTKLNDWYTAFKAVQTSTEVLLRLARESAEFETIETSDGFYQEDCNSSLNLIAIRFAHQYKNLFPEVSTSSRRFSIHFMFLDKNLATKPWQQFIAFELAKLG